LAGFRRFYARESVPRAKVITKHNILCFPFGVKRLWNIFYSDKVSDSETLPFCEPFFGPVAGLQGQRMADKRSASASLVIGYTN